MVTTIRSWFEFALGGGSASQDSAVRRNALDDARELYESGLRYAGSADPIAGAFFRARLGGLAAGRSELDDAVESFETSARLRLQSASDPFWAVVRMSAPAVPGETDLRSET
jgi:hypothetical protein